MYILNVPFLYKSCNKPSFTSVFTEKCSQNALLTYLVIVDCSSMCSCSGTHMKRSLNYQYHRIPVTDTQYLTTVLVSVPIPILMPVSVKL